MAGSTRRLPICLLIGAALLSSCAGQPAPTATPTATHQPPPPTATPPPPPTTTAPRPTPTLPADVVDEDEDVIGLWTTTSGLFLRFSADGKLNWGETQDQVDSAPYAVNEFWFEGHQMLIREIEVHGVPTCGTRTGKYLIRQPSPDALVIVRVADGCRQRAEELAGQYTRAE